MAYQNNQKQSFQSNSRPASAPRSASASGSAASTRKTVYKTGLFAPTKEGVKSLGSVQVKESVTIPAGSYINIYEADKKNENSPAYNLSITEGKLAVKK